MSSTMAPTGDLDGDPTHISLRLLHEVLSKIDVLIAGQAAIAGTLGVPGEASGHADGFVQQWTPQPEMAPTLTGTSVAGMSSLSQGLYESSIGSDTQGAGDPREYSHKCDQSEDYSMAEVRRVSYVSSTTHGEGASNQQECGDEYDNSADSIAHGTKREAASKFSSISQRAYRKSRTADLSNLSQTLDREPSTAGTRLEKSIQLNRRSFIEPVGESASKCAHRREPVGKMRHPIELQGRELLGALNAQPSQSLGRRPTFPLSPNSRIVLSMDVVAMLLLCYDAIAIPYILARDLRLIGYFYVFAWLSSMFWTADLLLRFGTGFADDDNINKNLKSIAKRYLSRFFFADFTVVAVDWLGLIFELTSDDSANGSSRVLLRMARVSKATRMLRIYAMLKTGKANQLREIVRNKASAMGVSTLVRFWGNIGKLLAAIAWLNHIVACLWLFILAHQPVNDAGFNWEKTVSEMHAGTSFRAAGLSESYTYSFAYFWSITTMFSGASFLVPMTTLETLFSLVCVLFGFLTASTIISSMAAMLMDSQEANRETSKQIQLLHRFLQQQDVPMLLSVMIRRQALHRLTLERRLVEDDVPVLSTLSAGLREQLRYATFSPWITSQFLWGMCDHVDDQLINNLCKFGLRSIHPNPGDVVFEPKTPMTQAYILAWGTMHHTLEPHFEAAVPEADRDDSMQRTMNSFHGVPSVPAAHVMSSGSQIGKRVTRILPGQQICEIAVWADWTSLGLLEAESQCEMLECSATGIQEVLEAANEYTRLIASSYAEALVSRCENSKVSHLSDIHSPTDYDSIVALMPQDARVLMSLPAIRAMKQSSEPSHTSLLFAAAASHDGMRKLQCLEDEVVEGTCNLRVQSGKVLRVVHVLALQMVREDGRTCTQLAKLSDSQWQFHWHESFRLDTGAIELPGIKMQMLESPLQAVDRLVSKRFPQFKPSISVNDWETSVEERASATYKIPTRYVRVVAQAIMEPIDYFAKGIPSKSMAWGDSSIEVFSVRDGAKHNVFAWLSAAEYAALTQEGVDNNMLVTQWAMSMRELERSTPTVYTQDI